MKYLDSFIEENRESFEILAAEHVKKINQYKKLEKKSQANTIRDSLHSLGEL